MPWSQSEKIEVQQPIVRQFQLLNCRSIQSQTLDQHGRRILTSMLRTINVQEPEKEKPDDQLTTQPDVMTDVQDWADVPVSPRSDVETR